MATIPTISGSRVIAAPTGGVQMNADALMAPGRALVGLGKSMSEASSVAAEFALRKQEAANDTALLSARMEMEKSSADFQSELSTMEDESKWQSAWTEKTLETRDRILSDSSLAPRVKEQLQLDLTAWSDRGGIAIRNQAERRAVQRMRVRLENVADFMLQNGRVDEAMHAYDVMEERGLIHSDEKTRIQLAAQQRADLVAVNRGLIDDPFTTLDQLEEKSGADTFRNFQHLDVSQRLALKVEAGRRIAAARTETIQSLVARRNAGEIIQPAELQQLVDQKRLLPTQQKWILAEQQRTESSPELVVTFAHTLSDIDRYDPAADPTNERYAELFGRSVALPAQYREEIQRRLEARRRSPREDGAKDARGYVDDLLKGGFLGDVTLVDGKPRNASEYQSAYGRSIELRQGLEAEVQRNPNMKPTEMRDWVNAKIRTERTARAATPILNVLSGRTVGAAPKQIRTKAERDALPAGTKYVGPDGQTYIRK